MFRRNKKRSGYSHITTVSKSFPEDHTPIPDNRNVRLTQNVGSVDGASIHELASLLQNFFRDNVGDPISRLEAESMIANDPTTAVSLARRQKRLEEL